VGQAGRGAVGYSSNGRSSSNRTAVTRALLCFGLRRTGDVDCTLYSWGSGPCTDQGRRVGQARRVWVLLLLLLGPGCWAARRKMGVPELG
jgi:hypothetical protein